MKGMHRLITAVAVAGILAAEPAAHARRIRQSQPAAPPPPVTMEHRYRVIGKIRFLFFWVGSNDVGTGRISWRGDAATKVIALLVGSDPRRAPRGINEWGYLREQVTGDAATIFGVRSLDNPDSLEQAEAKLAEGTGSKLFGALCSRVTATVDDAMTTTVRAGNDVTYRTFPGLLALINQAVHWSDRRVSRPPGAAPGFLTALQDVIRSSLPTPDRPAVHDSAVSVPFVYKAAVFTLRLEKAEPIAELRVGSRLFRQVIRGQFEVINHSTGDTTGFTVTYGTTGPLAAVPIQATYEPRWWLKLELALDDQADAPPDPAADQAGLDEIRAVCRIRDATHP
jgi:hypothetical protein